MTLIEFRGGPLGGEFYSVGSPSNGMIVTPQEVIIGEVNAEDAIFYWLEDGVYQFKGKRVWAGNDTY